MKTLTTWLEEYGESHQNMTNKRIHWLCVPTIFFTILGLLWAIHAWVALATMALILVFYFRLSPALFVGMTAFVGLCMLLIVALPKSVGLYLSIFVVAWIFQFIGHKVEGKKPSFFKDVQFLLIGPAWCMDFLYRKVAPNWRDAVQSS